MGNTRIERITGVPNNGRASAAGCGANSDTEDTNEDLERTSKPTNLTSDVRAQHE